MKIIELTETQFKNYSKLHSSRNYYQTVEYAHSNKGTIYYLGYINENDNTLMAAVLLLERSLGKIKFGYVPGSFLVDYNNDNLFKDFITSLKDYLKKKKYIYVTTDNISTYKMFDKTGDVVYYDTNIIKLFDELSFKKIGKLPIRNVVLETEKTPEETFKLFNANTKRNINLSIRRAINIYKDESNDINPLLDMNNTIKKNKIINIINNFNDDNVKAEVYYAKINPEQYVNNYRYILKEEDKRNDNLNEVMQNINVKKTDSIINKKTGKLFIESDFLAKYIDATVMCRYKLILSKNVTGKYSIEYEQLSTKKATSKSQNMKIIFEIVNGSIETLNIEDDKLLKDVIEKTRNLLTMESMSSLFYEKFLIPAVKENIIQNKKTMPNEMEKGIYIWLLFFFGGELHVFLDQSDDHREYVAINSLNEYSNGEKKLNPSIVRSLMRDKREYVDVVSVDQNIVSKHEYKDFEKTISKLAEFLRIFKADLKGIEIDKKENHDVWICDLVMNYETYNIHAEYESTGIKKLIQLFVYLREMVKGGIVFIDEFDSNLHDVYLCALLEYLAEYGEGQLCFTTHNVGPMDILKQYNKSIDFLSEDHKIYPWTKRGNYSPSKLYRNGMIEGNPFNIDSIDFIGVFGFDEEDE